MDEQGGGGGLSEDLVARGHCARPHSQPLTFSMGEIQTLILITPLLVGAFLYPQQTES